MPSVCVGEPPMSNKNGKERYQTHPPMNLPSAGLSKSKNTCNAIRGKVGPCNDYTGRLILKVRAATISERRSHTRSRRRTCLAQACPRAEILATQFVEKLGHAVNTWVDGS